MARTDLTDEYLATLLQEEEYQREVEQASPILYESRRPLDKQQQDDGLTSLEDAELIQRPVGRKSRADSTPDQGVSLLEPLDTTRHEVVRNQGTSLGSSSEDICMSHITSDRRLLGFSMLQPERKVP